MTLLDDVVVERKAHGQPSVGLVRPRRVPRVAITRWSARTGFGDLRETWEVLLSGRAVNDHARLEDLEGPGRARQAAVAVARSILGLAADAAVVVGTSKGSVEDWLAGDVPAAGLGDVAAEVARAMNLQGPRMTVSAACTSGLHALVRGAMMIQAGEALQVLVVAVETSVHPLFIGSFSRLGVLAKPGAGCRPFDRNRTGFYMSEAAAAVLLEAAEDDEDGSQEGVYVDRFALGGDATHLTGGDPQLRTLRHLLADVVDGRPVDLVHAHGTGTEANDQAELAAIESALVEGPALPSLYSHKGALGHSLGAAGLLSVVINCQAHSTGTVPPNTQTLDPLPATRVSVSRDAVRRPVRRSLAIAAGFGGATAMVGLVGA
jgi:3-oxoacyl-[acyl-carrier-protein] synthase II